MASVKILDIHILLENYRGCVAIYLADSVADPGGFQGFHGNPLLKFIYSNRTVRSRLSNRAVRLRCSNYSSFIRNHPVINIKYC